MKKVVGTLLAITVLCSLVSVQVWASEYDNEYEYYNEATDNSITIIEEGAASKVSNVQSRASSAWYTWSLGKWNAEANSYTSSAKTKRFIIDRIYARYMNVKNGTIVKDIRDDQRDSSHAAIGTRTIKFGSKIKGEFYFQKQGFETMKKNMDYN